VNETQTELFQPKAPAVSASEVEELEGLLERCGWLTAAEILRLLHKPVTDNQKRRLRAIANKSDTIVGGQEGYNVITNLALNDYRHQRNWMLSQIRMMANRVRRWDKIFYARQPAP
jgi:hypothetical protein